MGEGPSDPGGPWEPVVFAIGGIVPVIAAVREDGVGWWLGRLASVTPARLNCCGIV